MIVVKAMNTSSMMRVVARRQRLAASGREAAAIAAEASVARPTPANACRVVPPSEEAASPVDAVTNVLSSGNALKMCFSTRLLPVPVPRLCSQRPDSVSTLAMAAI